MDRQEVERMIRDAKLPFVIECDLTEQLIVYTGLFRRETNPGNLYNTEEGAEISVPLMTVSDFFAQTQELQTAFVMEEDDRGQYLFYTGVAG